MNDTPSLPRKPMLLIALAQGVALAFLYSATNPGAALARQVLGVPVEAESWLSQSPMWSYPLWTLSLAVPVLLLLSLERGNVIRVTRIVLLFSVVLALAAVYIGSQARPVDEFPVRSLTGIFALTMTVACLKGLMYLQQRAAAMPMSYQVLFTNSWRNFLTLFLALVFTFVSWLILRLWAALFDAIGIDFFSVLFGKDWFRFPVLGLAHGLGVIVFRNLTQVVDSITRLLQGLLKLLLPLVLLFAVGFVISLPFVGLDVLWSTGRGTALLLWLLAIILFFTNAVYQDGRGDAPYPTALHRLLYACLFVVPFIAALSFYGLAHRVGQYGLTVERCWAFIVWFVLTLFAVGYIAGILRKRDQWTLDLARVNTGMGLVVLAIMLLANSPVLDFRKISLASQLARVEAGEMLLENFDFRYVHSTLARPGHLALQEIKEQVADSNPDLLKRIDNPRRYGNRVARPPQDWWDRVQYRPDDFDVPRDLRQQIERENTLHSAADPVLVRADLNGDGQDEYALVVLYGQSISTATIYYRRATGWATVAASSSHDRNRMAKVWIKGGEIAVEPPRFKDLHIGEVVLRISDPAIGVE